MKIIKCKKTKEVKFRFPDDADIKVVKDGLGKPIIHIANYPPARVEGKTRYLGGTYICDQGFVADSDIVEGVEDAPSDFKAKKYKYDKATKKWEVLNGSFENSTE